MVLCCFCAALCLGVSSAHAAATWYVNSTTGNDTTGTGTSGSPYQTFTKAYAAASAGDTINLTGTFIWTNAGETSTAVTTGFTISKDLTITGQSATSTIIEAATSESAANRRIFTIASGVTATTSDLTIRYGNVGSSYYGGGILVEGTAIISACDISYNSAEGGGGVDVEGKALIENSAVHDNTAVYMGGGLNRDYYNASGGTPGTGDTMDILNTTIANNKVTSTVAYMEGGGVFYRRGYGSVTDSTIAYNEVSGDSQSSTQGIGTGNGAGTITLKDNIIAANIYSTYGGDIGERESGDGTFTDNGGNIIGRPGYYSGNYTAASSTWLDATTYSGTLDGTYTKNDGTGTHSGPLDLSSTLATNLTKTGTETLSITSGSSEAVGNGLSGVNGSISVPTTDQRGGTRGSPPGIGAYEYGAIPDTTPPTVSLTAPTAGEAISSTTTLAATASDDMSVAGVTFYVNGVKQGNEDTSSPYAVTFNTTATSSGTHTAFAVARDTSNNYATSSTITFTIDNIAPTVSLTEPHSSEATSSTMTLAATASDDTSVAGVKFYINGTLEGHEVTSSPYVITFDTTATSSGTHTAFAVARDTANNYATSTSISFMIQNPAPAISSISASSTSSGAVITWTTDQDSSSLVNFGLTSNYGTSTTEKDTSPRVTSHSLTIVGLPSCAQYHYQVESKNSVTDTATSSDQTFATAGCTGAAAISTSREGAITTSAGGTVTEGNLSLTVPKLFTATSSSVTFQANQLANTAWSASAGAPAGVSRVGTDVFHLAAFTGPSTLLPTFAQPLTVTLSYSASDVSGFTTSSLTIYRYDGSNWTALAGCSVDTSARTVSCTTTHFSDFALFGTETSTSSSSNSGTGTSLGAILSGYTESNPLPWQTTTSINATSTLRPSSGPTVPKKILARFSRNLFKGSVGADVTSLQQFLIGAGYSILAGTTGYFGRETRAAVIAYQKANAIVPAAGYVGPLTRALLNKNSATVAHTVSATLSASQVDAVTGLLRSFGADSLVIANVEAALER